MHKAALFLLLTAALCATETQEAKAPPKKVDTALRARVGQFYQALIDGKYLQAEQLVAADTKDFFVGSTKANYTSFEIKRIAYADDFHSATVTVLVNRMVPLEGFAGHPIPGMLPSHWKVEHGKWCWYVRPGDLSGSPFAVGQIPRGGTVTQPAMGQQHALPPMPNMFAGMVTADKPAVTLKSKEASSDQVIISNKFRSPVTLSIMDPAPPGIKVSLDHPDVKPGESTTVKIESQGASAKPATLRVLVRQLNQIITINVSFAP